jgi:hypothetical protein
MTEFYLHSGGNHLRPVWGVKEECVATIVYYVGRHFVVVKFVPGSTRAGHPATHGVLHCIYRQQVGSRCTRVPLVSGINTDSRKCWNISNGSFRCLDMSLYIDPH